MPSKSSDKRKVANRRKAYCKWLSNFKIMYKREPTEIEGITFVSAFNMGWKYHKKESRRGFAKIIMYKNSMRKKNENRK